MSKKIPSKQRFIPKNKTKYKGNLNSLVSKSSWEHQFMCFLDRHPSILEWKYESIYITYFNPIENRNRKYVPDFWFKYIDKEGNIKECLVEIKPYRKTMLRERATRIEKAEYAVNKAKFEAADKYCKEKGIIYKIITEKDIKFLK